MSCLINPMQRFKVRYDNESHFANARTPAEAIAQVRAKLLSKCLSTSTPDPNLADAVLFALQSSAKVSVRW